MTYIAIHQFTMTFYVSVIDCGQPPVLNSTQLTLINGTVYSSLVMYNCTEDHHVFNDESLLTETYTVCTEYGNWSELIYPDGCKGIVPEC